MRLKILCGLIAAFVCAPLARSQTPTQAAPTPRTSFDSPALAFDFPALHIGTAEYDEGPTGATVFYFPKGVKAVVDVRGGAPGTINTDALRLSYESAFVDAISFAGGSSYGLAVAPGVADAIKSQSANAGDWSNIATVAGAIIFDMGPRRFNTVTPDYELGRAALRAAAPGRFYLGARGAGRFAMTGGYWNDRQYSGQGGAFRQVGPTKVAVFTVVNALGYVVGRDGRIVRCGQPSPIDCGFIAERFRSKTATLAADSATGAGSGAGLTDNTTITLVVTNQKLPYWALQRLAVQVHSSMGRAIQPFATETDGDVLYAVTTGEVDNARVSFRDLGVIASELAWDAVLASVPVLDQVLMARADLALDARRLAEYAGGYEFGPGARATVSVDGTRLVLRAPERDSFYMPRGQTIELAAASADDFVLQTPRRDRVRFLRDPRGRVTALVINPGHWAIAARKID